MFFDTPKMNTKQKKMLMGVVIFWLTLFFGLRWDCGTDWDQYYGIFKGVSWDNFIHMNRYGGDSNENVEVGFAFVNIFLKTIGFGSYTFYLLITNLGRFWLMAALSFKLSRYPIVTFFGFLSLQYFFPTRNPFATAIYFFGFIYIVSREFRKYFMVFIAACSVHISSILMFFTYWLYGRHLKYWIQIGIYLATIAIATVLSGFIEQYAMAFAIGSATFDDKLETYSQSFREIEQTRSYVQYALPIFFLTIFEYVRRKLNFKGKNAVTYDFYVICYLIGICMWNILQQTLPDLCRYVEFINTWPILMGFVMWHFRRFHIPLVCILIAYYTYRLNNSINLGLYHDLFIPYRSVFGIF